VVGLEGTAVAVSVGMGWSSRFGCGRLSRPRSPLSGLTGSGSDPTGHLATSPLHGEISPRRMLSQRRPGADADSWRSLAGQDRSAALAVTRRIPGDRGGPESPRSVRNDGSGLLMQVMR
jgi:hypothetical protein